LRKQNDVWIRSLIKVDKASKIYVAGHTGMVGSAITRKLQSEGYYNLVFTPFPEYDLTDQQTVRDFSFIMVILLIQATLTDL